VSDSSLSPAGVATQPADPPSANTVYVTGGRPSTATDANPAGESPSTAEFFDHPYDFGDLSTLDDPSHEAVGRWGEYLSRNEIPAPKAERLAAFALREFDDSAPPLPHKYRIPFDSLGFSERDQANLQRFLGWFHKEGWSAHPAARLESTAASERCSCSRARPDPPGDADEQQGLLRGPKVAGSIPRAAERRMKDYRLQTVAVPFSTARFRLPDSQAGRSLGVCLLEPGGRMLGREPRILPLLVIASKLVPQ
jgi:hypothetical protein